MFLFFPRLQAISALEHILVLKEYILGFRVKPMSPHFLQFYYRILGYENENEKMNFKSTTSLNSMRKYLNVKISVTRLKEINSLPAHSLQYPFARNNESFIFLPFRVQVTISERVSNGHSIYASKLSHASLAPFVRHFFNSDF